MATLRKEYGRSGGIVLPAVDFTAPVVSAQTYAAQKATSESQQTLAAINAPIPIYYGHVLAAARILNVVPYGGHWYVQCAWCEGEIGQIRKIYLDGVVQASVSAHHYVGTSSQSVDTWLQTAFAANGIAYADTLPNIAYSVLKIPAELGFSDVLAELDGLLVYDPRTDSSSASENPALHLRDYLTEAQRYGCGYSVDDDSFSDLADIDDELVGGKPRRRCGTKLETVQSPRRTVELLRGYAGCWLDVQSGSFVAVPDRPRAADTSYSHAAGDVVAIRNLRRKGMRQSPTAVEVVWTNTSVIPWSEESIYIYAPGVAEGDKPLRMTSLALYGVHDKAQATRDGTEWLNKLSANLTCEIDVLAVGAERSVGDVVTLSAPVGLVSNKFRLLGIRTALGKYTLSLSEYADAHYADSVVSDPSTPDTSLPSSITPPAVSSLTAVERLLQNADGSWSSGLEVSWSLPASEWPYRKQFSIDVRLDGSSVETGTTPNLSWRSGALVPGDYSCIVSAIGVSGVPGEQSQYDVTVLGNMLPPTNVSNFRALSARGKIYMSWDSVVDIGTVQYEVRRWETGQTWDDGVVLDLRDTLTFESEVQPLGTYVVGVKAKDDAGLYSASAAYQSVTVLEDASAFTSNIKTHASPTLTGLTSYRLRRTDKNLRYVTSDGVLLGTSMTGALSAYTGILATHHAPVTQEWLGDAKDFASLVSGQWQASGEAVAVSGSVTTEVGVSTDGSSYTYNGTVNASGTFRFARLRHSASGSDTILIEGAQSVSVASAQREQIGSGTSSASGDVTITLSDPFISFTDITVNFQSSSPTICTIPSVSVGPPSTFDVGAWDAATLNRVSVPFTYRARGT